MTRVRPEARRRSPAVVRGTLAKVATLAGAVAALSVAGCSSDAAPEPEPDLRTRGAFVAVDEGGPGVALYRMLDTLVLEGQSDVYFVTHYDVAPADWDAAREVATHHDIPIAEPLDAFSESTFPAGPHRVVWFRTLTDEEEGRVP